MQLQTYYLRLFGLLMEIYNKKNCNLKIHNVTPTYW